MKTLFEPVTTEMAPEASRPALARIRKQYGYVPNLLATLANSPATLDGYLSLDASWSQGTLSGMERQIVLLAVTVANGCSYCEAAHAAGAAMLKASPAVIEAIRSSRPATRRPRFSR